MCWMCGWKLWSGSPAPAKPKLPALPAEERKPPPNPFPRPAAPPPAAAPAASDNNWTQPILIMAFVLILTGLAVGGGTGASLLWLGLLPAFFVTALAGFRRPKKEVVTLADKIEWVLTKLASTVAIVIIAAVAIVIALCALCAAIVGTLSVMGSLR